MNRKKAQRIVKNSPAKERSQRKASLAKVESNESIVAPPLNRGELAHAEWTTYGNNFLSNGAPQLSFGKNSRNKSEEKLENSFQITVKVQKH